MDSLTIETIDTVLHVADELVHTLPKDGSTEDYLYWVVGAVVAAVGLFAWYRKKNKKS